MPAFELDDFPAFCRIGEVAKLLGERPHVIRYWETEFKRWVRPRRSRKGQRIYMQHQLQSLLEIQRLLREELYTLAGAKRQLARHVQGDRP